MPVEFLVSLLCRLGAVCKTRTINKWTLAGSGKTCPARSETQTDPLSVSAFLFFFFKTASSRAKIISKVIHQPDPDSLTQTTVSANTDTAIHKATQALSVSARPRMNGKISENDCGAVGKLGKGEPTRPRENTAIEPE